MKQIRELSTDYHITTASFGQAPVGTHQHIELDPLPKQKGIARIPGIFSLLQLFHLYRWYEALDSRIQGPLRQMRGMRWDLIIAHDLQTLPIADRLMSRHGVLVDLHEYAPAQDEPNLVWRILNAPHYRWLCRTRVRSAAAVTTVSQGIADEYRRHFGIKATVVVNATPFHELNPGRAGAPLRLVHSGIAAPERRLEVLVKGMLLATANATLDFYLIDEFPVQRAQLERLAAGDPRIRFHPALPYEQLVDTLNSYDLGLIVFPPTTFNLAWCLPNKFFDYIQARLGLVIGPSPEMTRYVNEFGLGVVTESFAPEALARTIESLTPERVMQWKANSHASAMALAGERQSAIWAEIVHHLLS